MPKAGRPTFDKIETDGLFADWKEQAIQYIADKPQTELEWLALAQHHGLATWLLDWTLNPLVAAFFAVWEDHDCDAGIFAFESVEILGTDYSSDRFGRPEEPNVAVWIPKAISPRIIRQKGAFTIHEPATTPVFWLGSEDNLVRIRINKTYRKRLREELAHFGFSRASLFPDLDGLSAEMNWRVHQPMTMTRWVKPI